MHSLGSSQMTARRRDPNVQQCGEARPRAYPPVARHRIRRGWICRKEIAQVVEQS